MTISMYLLPTVMMALMATTRDVLGWAAAPRTSPVRLLGPGRKGRARHYFIIYVNIVLDLMTGPPLGKLANNMTVMPLGTTFTGPAMAASVIKWTPARNDATALKT